MRRRSRKKTPNNQLDIFDKEQYADKELIDIFQLWILRIYFKSLGIKSIFSDHSGFCNDTLGHFLDLSEYVDLDSDEMYKDKIIKLLKQKYTRLENRKRFGSNKILNNNIQKISKLMNLNQYEEDILKFAVFQSEYEILSDVTDDIGNNLNATQTKKALSAILNIPLKEVEKCFASGSKFSRSSLLTIEHYTNNLDRKLEFITDSFASKMLSSDESIEYMLKEVIYKCDLAELSLSDFDHLKKELSVVVPYLKTSVKDNKKGVNILFYGLPGTGKTELTKAIANELNQTLYEISYTDEDDEPIEGKKRLKAYKSAQTLLSNKNTILMFDEAEDVFNNDDNLFSKRQKNKAWINRILENNSIPTIWITNNVYSVDDAIIRRFDMSIEVPIPTKSKRKEIITKFSENQLSAEAISKLSANETIAPALVSRAAKVVATLENENKDKAFEMIIDSTLKAQGYDGIKDNSSVSLPKSYNPSYINCDMDLAKLTDGIAKSQNARVCLYGAAGTGKSAYGKYVADKLDKPLIIKKGSDLLSMWVGGTEKNIAHAFEEAKDEDAVLVFDEVDSFLADRNSASKNWEITQVNEMLVQMESFDGIFIATTNLMDNLDPASLRRFDLKLEFSFLKHEQAWKLFQSECRNIGLTRVSSSFKSSVESIKHLTPGDFAAVLRQNRFNPIDNAKDFIKRLEDEVAVKNIESSKKMGFI
jgi:SpoVK/Ycf46/Vps4 family AAA+-type ATPase